MEIKFNAAVKNTNIENSRNPLGLEKLSPRRIVIAAQVEELGQDLSRKGADLDRRRLLRHSGHAVTADLADLAFLILVVVAAHAARVLTLPLPHILIHTGDRRNQSTTDRPSVRPKEIDYLQAAEKEGSDVKVAEEDDDGEDDRYSSEISPRRSINSQ